MKESELLTFSLNALKLSGLTHWRMPIGPVMHSIGGRTIRKQSPIAGFPDIAGVTKDGLFFAIELKSEKGKVAPHQQAWIDKLNNSMAVARVVKTPQELLNLIQELGGKVKALQK
jgi:hypothetical protein